MTNQVRTRRGAGGAALREVPESAEQKAQLQYELEQEMRTMDGLDIDDEDPDLAIVDATPGRKYHVWYSMLDGHEERLPKFMRRMVLQARLPNGRPAYTAYRDDAPFVAPGTWKCFLHPEAPEREILATLGIFGNCLYAHGPSEWAKRGHEEGCHSDELKAYRDYVFRELDKAREAARSEEIAAIRDLASAALRVNTAPSAVNEEPAAVNEEPANVNEEPAAAAGKPAKAKPEGSE